jgi:hypothetical protein
MKYRVQSPLLIHMSVFFFKLNRNISDDIGNKFASMNLIKANYLALHFRELLVGGIQRVEWDHSFTPPPNGLFTLAIQLVMYNQIDYSGVKTWQLQVIGRKKSKRLL